ncbi:SDR family NAD(P)-dependent oxidoreductase [Rhodococcus wratislaviensis]|uniref:Putative oxidoreductase n=1 Tax=Rhodococcus wratislaviensis NBRC 100605 TaxID=1219028 RepID=X0R2I7_RHOWR|nr:SDR family oxidoreductase [Rhodococcus wratislaviensis]GAF45095.1 putative oxidoreductase [Rhodococcus wratislaviensis NBRC 100605]
MDLALRGTVAVVTGASKGIGLAITRALAAEGAFVVAGARSPSPELEELVRSGTVEAVSVDLSTPTGPGELVAAATARGSLGVVVNNVGAAHPRLTGFLDVTDEDWITTMNLNLMSAVRTIRAALPTMIAAGRGSIVTTSSVNSFLPDPTVIDYCASKAALTNFSKALSKELGPLGIRVNTVSPGPVSTALWLGDDGVAATVARAAGGDPDAVAERAAKQAVTGRFTRPDEVADLVVFLASDRAGNVTGSDFVIDGGLVTTL